MQLKIKEKTNTATWRVWGTTVKSNAFTEKEKSIPLDRQKEICFNIVAEKTGTTEKLHISVNFQILIYHFKGVTKGIDFSDFITAETLFDCIKSKK